MARVKTRCPRCNGLDVDREMYDRVGNRYMKCECGEIYELYEDKRKRLLREKLDGVGDVLSESDKLKARCDRYGLSVDEVGLMLEGQGGCCPICGRVFGVRLSWVVDQDGDNGMIRGLLCVKCRGGLDKFNNSSSMLYAAGMYLAGAKERYRDEVAKDKEASRGKRKTRRLGFYYGVMGRFWEKGGKKNN